MNVREVAAAFAGLLESGVEGGVNIASGTAVSVGGQAELVALHAGHPELLRVGARRDRPVQPPRLLADARRIREEVGFAASAALPARSEETVAWWRTQLAGTAAR